MRLEAVEPSEVPARRVLGIDIENKPLWYGGGDFVYDRDVCYSWKWLGEDEVSSSRLKTETVWLDWRLPDWVLLNTLKPLRDAIEESTHLLGHNFQHDWKGLRATFNHLRQPFLPARPIIDTMRCLPGGMPRSLEWLVAHFGLGEKPHVTAHTWVSAIDRNEQDAIMKVIDRNRADVELTEKLYWTEKGLGWIA